MKDTTKDALKLPADFEKPEFGYLKIRDWAESIEGGSISLASAKAFANWLNQAWNDYGDSDDLQTNEDVLYGALSDWTGGRIIRPTDRLRTAYADAEKAHAALYDESQGDEWRRGPHPIRLADFFAAMSGTGALSHLKD